MINGKMYFICLLFLKLFFNSRVEEYWEPSIENLESLVVVREVPTIHILLSKDPLNTEEPGYI